MSEREPLGNQICHAVCFVGYVSESGWRGHPTTNHLIHKSAAPGYGKNLCKNGHLHMKRCLYLGQSKPVGLHLYKSMAWNRLPTSDTQAPSHAWCSFPTSAAKPCKRSWDSHDRRSVSLRAQALTHPCNYDHLPTRRYHFRSWMDRCKSLPLDIIANPISSAHHALEASKDPCNGPSKGQANCLLRNCLCNWIHLATWERDWLYQALACYWMPQSSATVPSKWDTFEVCL